MPPVRVLLTKSFIDSHDRAIRTVAATLRDAGLEVVLVDYEIPDDVVHIALQEDVDVIGLSFMSGGQVHVTEAVMSQLAAVGLRIPVVVGGTIRPFDVDSLMTAGVSSIFRGGETLASMAEEFSRLGRDRQQSAGRAD